MCKSWNFQDYVLLTFTEAFVKFKIWFIKRFI